ncbi:MAG: xanthine dehydrogenase family protein molybdopterin-binding subunit [Beijerinckiaceae bacterium]|nr:xanthine dehydrogenase family protein molybdopterin-binding subunit [Beijerinckiaceae bacterium]
MTRFSISQPVRQVEAPRLLQGRGRFTDDVTLDNQAYAFFLRSPHAHAEIRSIDTRAALQMPGVRAILTGEDYAADGLGDVRGLSPAKRRDGSPMFRPPRPGLTRDRVRHVGQPMAVVIADSVIEAKDASERIEIDYEPLPIILSTAHANEPGAPAIWADCPNNEPVYGSRGNKDAAEKVFASAPHVVRDRFVVNRVAAMTMETRAVNAEYDAGRDHYTIYACLQRPYVWRTMMAKFVFNDMAEHHMTLIAGDVGGSYGMKGGLYPEVPVVAWASRRVGRPVKWTCERSEALIADDQGRDMVIDAGLAFDNDGKFLGVTFSSRNNVGAYLSMLGFLSTLNIINDVCGAYTIPAVFSEGAAVMTNTLPVSNYRAPGGAPSAYVIERLVDMAAREIGMDPAEIRRRNLVPREAMPYKTATGHVYDCGDFPAVLEKCLAKADYAGVKARKAQSSARGLLRGVGISSSVDPSAGPSPEAAELRFDPSGGVTILVGSTAGGQSHETIYTQIVSDRLGIDAENIRVIEGNTEKLSWGTGTGAARTATIGGSVVFKAVDKIIEKAKRIAAHALEASVNDVSFEDGVFRIAGTDRSVTLKQVAQSAFNPASLPPDIEIGLYETATWSPEVGNLPNSSHVCEVEIDPETGVVTIDRYTAVHDVGVELNPLLVEGQVHGGIVQGASQALMENIVYEEGSGQVLSGSFMDYAMPRADDFCSFEIDRHPVPAASNPLGVKGAGECGTVGALPAVMNAINDALAPLGVRNIAMPCTPDRVWRAIRDASAKKAG